MPTPPDTLALGLDVPVDVFEDHIVLRPPNRLKERATRRVDPAAANSPDPVRRAEHALELLSNEFGAWMDVETQSLELARQAAGHSRDIADIAELYRCAHDIRGQAATFGFPLAGEIAEGLCDLIDKASHRAPPQTLLDRHVEAIRAIVREDARGHDNPLGVALVRRLAELREAQDGEA